MSKSSEYEYKEHRITLASFAQIDQEMGPHELTPVEYAIARRVVHTTADFEFKQLLQFSGEPIMAATVAFQQGATIITDVSMVAAGIRGVAAKTWKSAIIPAIKHAPARVLPHQTRSSEGMRQCLQRYPGAIVAVGNAPTALLSLCAEVANKQASPALVIGAPVGFINVVESKQLLQSLSVPYVLVEGRKGGSAVAAAILNAIMIWTWQQRA